MAVTPKVARGEARKAWRCNAPKRHRPRMDTARAMHAENLPAQQPGAQAATPSPSPPLPRTPHRLRGASPRSKGIRPADAEPCFAAVPATRGFHRHAYARHRRFAPAASLAPAKPGARKSSTSIPLSDEAATPASCIALHPQHSAPPHGRGAGGRQAAWGLLRDQIRSCVPSSPSMRRA